MPSHPGLYVIPDGAWLSFLAEQRVESFYHNPRIYAWLKARNLGFLKWVADAFAPRGFSRLDGADGSSAGDGIYLKQSVVDAFAQVVKLHRTGRPIPLLLWVKANAAPHEHYHTRPDVKPTPAQLARFSHPNELVLAIQHARRVQYRPNAFSGLLRSPKRATGDDFEAAVNWFEHEMARLARQ